jgi:hypothetical protein
MAKNTEVVVVSPVPSLTDTVAVKSPAVVGIPVTAPVVEFRLKPGGRVPPDNDQVNGAVPLPEDSVVE